MRTAALLLIAASSIAGVRAQSSVLYSATEAGARTASAEYIIDSTLGGFGGVVLQSANASIRSGFSGQLNEAPTLQPKTLERAGAISAKMPIAILLEGASDLEGDSFTLMDVDAASVNGAPILSFEGWLAYNSSLPAPDSFTFRVVDSFGSVSAETISVINIGPSGAQTFLRAELINGGPARRIFFVGIPGRSYTIQETDTLQPANWQNLGNATAAANGVYSLDDANASQTRFYRAVQL